MQFTYVENRMPVPNAKVLAAWTDGNRRYIRASAWSGENWYDWESSDGLRPFYVYAWTPWPETPEPSSHE